MKLKYFILLFLTQICYSQERVDVLIDSLTLVSDYHTLSEISQEIALEFKDSDWERTLHYLEYSEEIALKSNSEKTLAKHNLASANIYYSKDAFDIALEYYLKAYNYYKNFDKDAEKYIVENDLAIIYARLKNKEKALYYFKHLAKHWEENKDSLSLAKVYNNMGTFY